jgi:hypothetical protein
MKKILGLLLVTTGLLGGCQSIGDHFDCMAEVDRNLPAQTQQRYIRTDTKCIQSSEKTITGPFGANFGTVPSDKGDINCSAIPIYETIVLNQAQRETAYQQCRNRIDAPSGYIPNSSNQKSPEEIRRYDAQRTKCDSIKDNDLFLACMRDIRNAPILKTKLSPDTPYCIASAKHVGQNSAEYKSQCEQSSSMPTKVSPVQTTSNTVQSKSVNPSISVNSTTLSMEQAKQKCIDLGFKSGTESFGQCVLKVAK